MMLNFTVCQKLNYVDTLIYLNVSVSTISLACEKTWNREVQNKNTSIVVHEKQFAVGG